MADKEKTDAEIAQLQSLLCHLADVHAEEFIDAKPGEHIGAVIMLFARDGAGGAVMGGAFVSNPPSEMPRVIRRALQVIEKTAADMVRGTVQLPPTGKLDS